MISLKLNKTKLKDHFRYFVWVYVAVDFCGGGLLNVAVTISKNQSPPEEKLYSFICGDAINVSYFHTFWEEMTNAFPDMALVSCENITYNVPGIMANEQKQKFLSFISNKYGDVMILPYQEFADLAENGIFEPLENDFGEYIDNINEESLKTVRFNLKKYGEHIYGIPLDNMEFFPYTYDTSDKVLVLTEYSLNKENAKRLVKWWLDYMIETDWYGTIE